MRAKRTIRLGLALLLARRGGRSVPDDAIVDWGRAEGVSEDETLAALARLADERAIYRDAHGWRIAPVKFAPRPAEAFARGARLHFS